MSVKERVAMMWGQEVAETLAGEGLLASDTVVDASTPDRWRIYYRWDGQTSVTQPPRSLLNGLSHRAHSLWNWCAYQNGTGRQDPRWVKYIESTFTPERLHDLTLWGSVDVDSKQTAVRHARMARKIGMAVRVVPLVYVELPEVPL